MAIPRKSESLSHPGNSFRSFPFFFLLVLLVLPFPMAPRQIELRFQSFGIEDGMNSNLVTSLFADRRGFLWVGTYWGLSRYDSYSFQRYQHRPGDVHSLSHDYISYLHDDRLGRIWVSTGTGLDILDPHSGQVTRLAQARRQWGAAIQSIEETRSGEMWIGTTTGKLVIFDSASGRMLPLPAPFRSGLCPGKTITRILEDSRGDIWIGSACGLLRYTPASGRLASFKTGSDKASGILGNRVYDICQDEKGSIWIANSDGLNRFDAALGSFAHFPFPGNSGPNEEKHSANMSILADISGWIWIGTDEGIKLFDREREAYVKFLDFRGDPTSFDPIEITSACQDRSGNIWIGCFGTGLCQFNLRVNRFRFVRPAADPQHASGDPWVNYLLKDRSGIAWIGTRRDGLLRYDPASGAVSRVTALPPSPGSGPASVQYILGLCEDSSGSLWVGLVDGLFAYDRQSGRFRRFAPPHAMAPPLWPPRDITCIRAEEPDTLWISTYSDGVFRVDKKSRACTLYTLDEIMPAGLYPRRVEWLFLDRFRSLWIGTKNGLHCLDRAGRGFSHFLPGLGVWGMVEDRNGHFWVATSEGLVLLDRLRGTFGVFGPNEGLGGDRAYDLAEDEQGYIWVGTNRGLSRFDPRRETFRNFDASDGVSCGGANNLILCRDGQILAGGTKGLLTFDPQLVAAVNSRVPPVVVTALHIGNRTVPLNEVFLRSDQAAVPGRVVLRPNDRLLSVEFAALDFSSPGKNRYAFRMDGRPNAWSDLGTQRQITFSSLGVGEHTLRIKGSNNDGIWNKTGIVLQIVVLPHFWQTWWFKLLALLLLTGIALVIFVIYRTIASLKKIATPPNLEEIFNKHKISHREQEILFLVIQGKSNREMEDKLFISLPTVRRHLANIYEKIGVSSRLQLINFLQGRKPHY
jgi:two-component system sensor histidine kinase ChiS